MLEPSEIKFQDERKELSICALINVGEKKVCFFFFFLRFFVTLNKQIDSKHFIIAKHKYITKGP